MIIKEKFTMVGGRLKQLRRERKLTQSQLGKIINVTKVSISGYESGDRTPDTDNLKRLADFFDVTTDYLLGRSDDPRLTESEEKEVDKEEQELIDLLNQLPEDERKKYIQRFKAYVDINTYAKNKDND